MANMYGTGGIGGARIVDNGGRSFGVVESGSQRHGAGLEVGLDTGTELCQVCDSVDSMRSQEGARGNCCMGVQSQAEDNDRRFKIRFRRKKKRRNARNGEQQRKPAGTAQRKQSPLFPNPRR